MGIIISVTFLLLVLCYVCYLCWKNNIADTEISDIDYKNKQKINIQQKDTNDSIDRLRKTLKERSIK